MLLRTAICDDEIIGIKTVERFINHYSMNTGIDFKISTFSNPDTLIQAYKNPGMYDLLFLDMEMPIDGTMKYGIEVARQIRALNDYNIKIIFMSNYPEYMHMGYDVQASHYLSKDVSFEKFDNVIDSIVSSMSCDNSVIRIKTGRDEWSLLRLQDILFIKSTPGKRDFVLYYSIGGIVEEHVSIQSVFEEVKTKGFAYANKNYLVNLKHIIKYSKDTLTLDGQHEIILSRHYKKAFLDIFSQNIISF